MLLLLLLVELAEHDPVFAVDGPEHATEALLGKQEIYFDCETKYQRLDRSTDIFFQIRQLITIVRILYSCQKSSLNSQYI